MNTQWPLHCEYAGVRANEQAREKPISKKRRRNYGMLHKNTACIFTRKSVMDPRKISIYIYTVHRYNMHINTNILIQLIQSILSWVCSFHVKFFFDRNRVLCGTFSSPHFNKSIDLNSSIDGIIHEYKYPFAKLSFNPNITVNEKDECVCVCVRARLFR